MTEPSTTRRQREKRQIIGVMYERVYFVSRRREGRTEPPPPDKTPPRTETPLKRQMKTLY